MDQRTGFSDHTSQIKKKGQIYIPSHPESSIILRTIWECQDPEKSNPVQPLWCPNCEQSGHTQEFCWKDIVCGSCGRKGLSRWYSQRLVFGEFSTGFRVISSTIILQEKGKQNMAGNQAELKITMTYERNKKNIMKCDDVFKREGYGHES